jgi:hypothetical protein
MTDRRMGQMFDQGGYVPIPRRDPRDRSSAADAREEAMIAARRIGSMANPERFSDALTRMPLSTAPVEYEPSYHADPLGRFPPATFNDRFRGM